MANENIKLNFVILCDNAFVAQGTNTLNIIGIFDKIGVRKFPAIHPRLVVVTNASGDQGEYRQMIVIKNKETNEKIAELPGKLKINESGQKTQFIGNFLNIRFPVAGEYVIEVYISDKKQNMKTNFFVE